MIGVGTDIVEIKRIEKAISRTPKFIEKLCTKEEMAYLEAKGNPCESVAGLFAAKEAVSKALGTGFRAFTTKDINITHDSYGKPEVILLDKAKERMTEIGGTQIALSISHSKEYAVAFCILQ